MKRKSLRLLVFPLFALITILTSATAVYATTILQPDTPPSFSNIHVNRNLLTTGDMFIYGTCYIPYLSEPTTVSSGAFFFRLISVNGTVEYAANVPYVYFNRGYNRIAFSLYLTDNTTWGQANILRLSENPALFTSPVNFDTVLDASQYSTYTSREDNRDELSANVINIATYLQAYYPTVTFLIAVQGGFALASPTGETYFAGVMPQLQYMAPDIFLLQSYSGDIASTNWALAQFDIYDARFTGTWVGAATSATATQFHITPAMVTSLVIILPLCVGAIIVSSRKYLRAEPGFIFCSIVLILGAVMGWLPAAIFAVINQLEGIYIAYVLFYARG